MAEKRGLQLRDVSGRRDVHQAAHFDAFEPVDRHSQRQRLTGRDSSLDSSAPMFTSISTPTGASAPPGLSSRARFEIPASRRLSTA